MSHTAHILTLHYAIYLEDGSCVVDTFSSQPATLQLGSGELPSGLERCLLDLPPGERKSFALEPKEAFGVVRPELLQTWPKADLPTSETLKVGALLQFDTEDGETYIARVARLDTEYITLDLNHPLAGKPIRFEAEILHALPMSS